MAGRKPRLLDLFCGEGGASAGYVAAGFEVVGVDIAPMDRYPFEFHQADAMTFSLEGFDAIHASPPCHDHTILNKSVKKDYGTGWMLAATIERLKATGVPWVVENVEAKTVTMDGWYFTLCGSMFGLRVQRHRRFGSSQMFLPPTCDHKAQRALGPVVTVTGHSAQGREYRRRKELGIPVDTLEDRKAAMGIDWMSRDALSEAIPPAYTKWIGEQLLDVLEECEWGCGLHIGGQCAGFEPCPLEEAS